MFVTSLYSYLSIKNLKNNHVHNQGLELAIFQIANNSGNVNYVISIIENRNYFTIPTAGGAGSIQKEFLCFISFNIHQLTNAWCSHNTTPHKHDGQVMASHPYSLVGAAFQPSNAADDILQLSINSLHSKHIETSRKWSLKFGFLKMWKSFQSNFNYNNNSTLTAIQRTWSIHNCNWERVCDITVLVFTYQKPAKSTSI